jgi:hypothetical protein
MIPCKGCGVRHDPRLRCETAARLAGVGVGADNAVTSRPSVIRGNPGDSGRAVARKGSGEVRVGRTANRRVREAYNAYQREYMRRKRAAKRTKVLGDGTRPPEVKSGSE